MSETTKVTWHDFWTHHKTETHSIAWYAKQFDCSWGTARDNIEGTIDRGGKIVGWVNEPVIEPESEIDPMEQLIQGRLILIEVAISCQGVLTRCKNLTSDFEAGIRALNEVSKVATIQDTNEQLNERLNAAQHSLVAANSYIEELKARLGMSS